MNILAVETSTELGSVALLRDSNLVAEKTWSREGSHSEFLTSSTEELLGENNLSADQIGRLAVGLGPGSFTGIRVAVNFARTFSYSTSCSVFAMNSLELLAYQPNLLKYSGTVAVIQYGFRDIFYAARFQLDQSRAKTDLSRVQILQAPFVIQAAQIQNWLQTNDRIVGSGIQTLKNHFNAKWLESLTIVETDISAPKASFFSQTLVAHEKCDSLTDWIHTIPLYIRMSEAEEKLRPSN